MKKILFFYLFIFNALYSQETSYEGYVYSENTNLPIENVVVKIKVNNNSYHSITNSEGKFKFPKIKEIEISNIEISHLGYKKESFDKTESTFYLVEKTNKLNEISISSEKEKSIYKLSFSDKIIVHAKNLSWDHKVAVFIPQEKENKNKTIKKILYAVSDFGGVKGLKYLPFSANLYSLDTISKLPKSALIEKSITIKKNNEKKWVEVDVSKFKLKVPPEGLFIVMELLNKNGYSGITIQSNIGTISAVPAIKAYNYNKNYIRKSYINYGPNSFILVDSQDKWLEQDCHYLMAIEFE